jgi:hypothetical protein
MRGRKVDIQQRSRLVASSIRISPMSLLSVRCFTPAPSRSASASRCDHALTTLPLGVTCCLLSPKSSLLRFPLSTLPPESLLHHRRLLLSLKKPAWVGKLEETAGGGGERP